MDANTISMRQVYQGAPTQSYEFTTRDDMNTALSAMKALAETLGYDVYANTDYAPLSTLPHPIFVWSVSGIDGHRILNFSTRS